MVGFYWSVITLALGFLFSFSSSFEADSFFEKPPYSNHIHDKPCLNNQGVIVCCVNPVFDTFFKTNSFLVIDFDDLTVFGVLKNRLNYLKKGFLGNVSFTGSDIVYPFHFFL